VSLLTEFAIPHLRTSFAHLDIPIPIRNAILFTAVLKELVNDDVAEMTRVRDLRAHYGLVIGYWSICPRLWIKVVRNDLRWRFLLLYCFYVRIC
jgi:hypothetical protein